eukprot:Filipodium_phascolosomae@DN1545_c0_g1_i2.p1
MREELERKKKELQLARCRLEAQSRNVVTAQSRNPSQGKTSFNSVIRNNTFSERNSSMPLKKCRANKRVTPKRSAARKSSPYEKSITAEFAGQGKGTNIKRASCSAAGAYTPHHTQPEVYSSFEFDATHLLP